MPIFLGWGLDALGYCTKTCSFPHAGNLWQRDLSPICASRKGSSMSLCSSKECLLLLPWSPSSTAIGSQDCPDSRRPPFRPSGCSANQLHKGEESRRCFSKTIYKIVFYHLLNLLCRQPICDFVKNTCFHSIFLKGQGFFLDMKALVNSSFPESVLFDRPIYVEIL